MKKMTIAIIIGLLTQQITQAQGTTYLSNLGQPFNNNNLVGSDSWLAADFSTGNNVGGYTLDSLLLGMTNATGNPSGFTVMIYSSGGAGGFFPASNLATLSGSANPSTADIYTYTPVTSLTLSPSTDYFIVLTTGTTVANGAYGWNVSDAATYNPSGGWIGSVTLVSNNGSSWRPLPTYPNMDFSQYAITATAIPEPSSELLILLGSGLFFYVRKRYST